MTGAGLIGHGGFLCKRIIAFIAAGLVIRLVVGCVLTYTFDVTSWAVVITNFETGNGLYGLAGYNYAPPWGYVLAVFSAVIEFLGVGSFGGRATDFLFVEANDMHIVADVVSLEFTVALTLMFFLFDLLVGYMVFWTVMDDTGDRRKAENGFGLWFLCPFVIVIGAAGGMFDALVALLVVLCVVMLKRDRCLLAGILLGTASMMKFFPLFLAVPLLGYVWLKHRGDGGAVRSLAGCVAGFALAAVVLLLPEALQGNLMDCFGFLLNRASSDGGVSVTGVLTVIAYAAFLVVSVLMGRSISRSKRAADDVLLPSVLLMTIILFLFPSTPQYILLMYPFLVMWIVETGDRRYMRPLALLMVGTTLFVCDGPSLLTSFAEYTGLISVDAVVAATDWFLNPFIGDISAMTVQYYAAAVLQWVALFLLFLTHVKVLREGPRQAPEAARRGSAAVHPDRVSLLNRMTIIACAWQPTRYALPAGRG